MGIQRLGTAELLLEEPARSAREAGRLGDAPRRMAVGPEVLEEPAELGQGERPAPSTLPDLLQDRVVVGEAGHAHCSLGPG